MKDLTNRSARLRKEADALLAIALTGLRTRVDLVSGKNALGYALAILAFAVTGKLVGAAFAAKVVGATWKDSLGLGVLMNPRSVKKRRYKWQAGGW